MPRIGSACTEADDELKTSEAWLGVDGDAVLPKGEGSNGETPANVCTSAELALSLGRSEPSEMKY